MKYLIKRDSKEKRNNGWIFPEQDNCLGTETCHLKTGDYTINGIEDKFVIERKRNAGELSQNINQSRFERELIRLEAFEHPFIVLEFQMEDIITFPFNSGIPPKYWPELKVTPKYFMRRLNELMVNYKTKIIFAGTKGKEFSWSLFKRISEIYGFSS